MVSIALPPLRERREEIPLLTEYFLKKYSVQYNKPFPEITDEMLRLFMEHDWPGNVRELENLIKRAVVLGGEAAVRKEITHSISVAAHRVAVANAGSGQQPGARSVPAGANGASPRSTAAPNGKPVAPPPPTPTSIAAAAADAGNFSLKDISREAARQAERELILRMLQQTRWNRKETAEILGISYKALLYKIKENGLDKAS